MRTTLVALGLCGLLAGCDSSSPDKAVDANAVGVILMRYNPGSESTEQRERGFLETMEKEFPQVKILSSDQYAGTTPEGALDKSQQVLLKYGDRVTGVFAVCEPNATGMLEALDQTGHAGKVKFVGFDPNPTMTKALEEGRMQGIVLQDPVRMGYESVKTIVAHLSGEKVQKRISTGEYIATPENMKEERMHALLNPPQFESEADEAQPAEVKYQIAVIPKGTTHEFWKSVHFGAEKAAKELGNVDVHWKGPIQEDDRDGQISVVQDFITKKVDGIVLAPLDSQALVNAVKDAKDAGIPTVIFDSGLNDESIIVSYVATDNANGGALAARRLAELVTADEKSK
jgi:ABC-type sugar transport system substrate-binding protein